MEARVGHHIHQRKPSAVEPQIIIDGTIEVVSQMEV